MRVTQRAGKNTYVSMGPLTWLFLGTLALAVVVGIGALLLAWPVALAIWLFPGNAVMLTLGWVASGVWCVLLLIAAIANR